MSFPAGGSPSGFSVRSLPAEPVAKPGTKRKWPGWAVFFGKLSKPGVRPMNGPRLLTRFQKARRPGRGAGVWARRFRRLWGAARRSRRFSKNHVTQRAGRQKPAAWKARATPGRSSGGFPKSRALRAPERGRGLLLAGVFGGPHPVGLFGGVTFGGVASCGAFGWARPQFRFGPAHVAVPPPAQINPQTRLPMQSVPGAPHLGGRLSDKICRSCRPLQKNHTKYDEIVK